MESKVSAKHKAKHNTPQSSSTAIPICPGCRRPMMVRVGKRPMPSTNLVELTYCCETCGTTKKRMVKES